MRVMWSALAAGAAEIAPQVCHHHLLTFYFVNLLTPSCPGLLSHARTTFQVFSGSCLLPLLWQLLHNGSLLDIGSHAARCEMYCAMLSVVQARIRRDTPEM